MRLLNFIRSRGDAKGCQSRDVKKRGCTHNIGQTIVVLAVMEALLVISIHVRAESISKGVVIGTRWLIYSESAQAITSLS